MRFESSPPPQFSFSQDAHILLGHLSNRSSIERTLRFSNPEVKCVRHVGQAEFIDPARLTTITELDGVIAEIEIQKVVNPDSFYGIPLKLAPKEFCAELERASIPFSMVQDQGIILYEYWTSFFIEDDEIVNISWMNPSYYSDLDIIELAFPSNSGTLNTVVSPVLPIDSTVKKAWELIKEVLPEAPAPGPGWERQIIHGSTPEQLHKIIKLLSPLATTSFENPATREFFAIASNLGATELDVTPIIDEAEHYQESTDPVVLEMIDDDQALLLDVISPPNFEQFNRYLKLNGTALLDNQIEFLRKAVKNKMFRSAPEFQWLATSRFATIPEAAYAISFIGQKGPILWDSAEEESLIEALESGDSLN